MSNKINKLKQTILVTLFTLALTACGGSSDSNTPSQQVNVIQPTVELDYQTLINETVSVNVPGVILLVENSEKRFLGSAGLADTESQEPMQTYHIMPIGSAGKKLTALLVDMLEEEGMLNLDNTIDTWLSEELLAQIAYSDKITLRQLLNHTAGLYDYINDSEDYANAVYSDPSSLKTDAYAVQFALNKTAWFEPGTDWRYSNTGYILAGLILDEVLGEHHSSAIRSRILDPLGMNSSHYGGVEKDRNEIISGYFTFDNGDVVNTKAWYENIGTADAPLMANVEDVALLLKTIISDDSFVSQHVKDLLFGETNLQAIGDGQYYGQGIITDTINGTTIYYHDGLNLGYSTTDIYIPSSQTSITVFFNCGDSEGCQNETYAMVQKVLLNELK